MSSTLAEIVDNFVYLEDWDDRYRYLIELGRALTPLSETDRTDANRVRGCASQVWLRTHIGRDSAGVARLDFFGDSDAHIVRGLVALTLSLFSGRTAADILQTDPQPVFDQLGLSSHLTPQRANGLRAMVDRIKAEARAVA